VPGHIHTRNIIGNIWSTSGFGRWLRRPRARQLDQLASYETQSSQFLAAVANLPLLQCRERFKSTLVGLSEGQAAERIVHDGPNILSTAKPRAWWTILLHCILNPFNVLLMVLAIISLGTQELASFFILTGTVFISVVLRFWQELKNNIAMNELVALIHDDVLVIRATVEKKVAKSCLVVGDLIRLGGGDVVAADVRLIDTAGLYVNQSTLTGEGIAVLKRLSDEIATPGSILECPRICFAGTSIMSGHGIGIVVATGDGIQNLI